MILRISMKQPLEWNGKKQKQFEFLVEISYMFYHLKEMIQKLQITGSTHLLSGHAYTRQEPNHQELGCGFAMLVVSK